MSVWTRLLLIASTVLLLAGGALPAMAAQPVTSSYESPTYGYEVSWDSEVWTVDDNAVLVAAGPAAVDQIRLVHAAGASLHVVAGQYGYADANGCVSAESAVLASERGVAEYGPLLRDDGEEMAGAEGDIAYGGFQLTYAPTSGTPAPPLDLVNFIECRLLPGSGAALVFTLITTPDQFEQHLAEAGTVNASLTFAQAEDAATTPTAEGTGAPGDETWFAAQVAAATAGASVAGPESGELRQTIGTTALFVPAAEDENFYLRLRFQNPPQAIDAPWDFGVAFREQSSGEHYRLVVDSSSGWYLSLGVESDVQAGTVSTLETGAGGINSLELVVAGDVGAFRLNGEVVGPLDLSALAEPGQIAIGTAFFAGNTTEGAVTSYRDLQIWPLAVESPADPGATPAAEPAPTSPIAETPEPAATSEPSPASSPQPTEEPAETPAAVPAVTVSADQVVIRLSPINQSGVEGLAILYPDGDRTTIALTILGVSVDEVGAIHAGTCNAFDPLPSYALAVFDAAGRTSSTINVELSELRSTPLVVLLHKSTAEFGNIVACGELPPG